MNNDFTISRYTQSHTNDIISAIGGDPNWQIFTGSESSRSNYIMLLKQSVTYVCYLEDCFCGYIRAILDAGLAIYISELFVRPEYRNRKIAQKLIEEVKANNSSITIYALSDEDLFYEKKGYKRVGSVFEV